MKTSEKKEFVELINEESKFIENYRRLCEEEKVKFSKIVDNKVQKAKTD